MKKLVVTGGSGKAGRSTVRDLLDHGYEVLNADIAPPRERICPFLRTDLTELGQAFEALRGADAVVHLAAIPAPGMQTDEVTFRANIASTYNVFTAATTLGLQRIVWASSETVLGLPYVRRPPQYAPMDELHPLAPESSYALSKVLSEEMARQFSLWHDKLPIVGLRFTNIMEPPHDYQPFAGWRKDVQARRWNLWGYVDARDVAQSCRLGFEADIRGAEVFIIAAADTVMDRPSRELMREVFPASEIRAMGEYGTLLSIEKARRMLGYEPRHSWRDGTIV
jgi:nucleoside-diphosphate-sugar epimerase